MRINLIAAAVLGVASISAWAQIDGISAIASPDAPEAVGPYSQAIKAGNFTFLAGQIAIDPKTGKMQSDASVAEQTRLVLDNLKAVLAADGMTMANIVSTTIYVKNLEDYSSVNEVYGTYFSTNPPARATVQADMVLDAAVEISAIAYKP